MDRREMEAGEGGSGCAGARAHCRSGELLSSLNRAGAGKKEWH